MKLSPHTKYQTVTFRGRTPVPMICVQCQKPMVKGERYIARRAYEKHVEC